MTRAEEIAALRGHIQHLDTILAEAGDPLSSLSFTAHREQLCLQLAELEAASGTTTEAHDTPSEAPPTEENLESLVQRLGRMAREMASAADRSPRASTANDNEARDADLKKSSA